MHGMLEGSHGGADVMAAAGLAQMGLWPPPPVGSMGPEGRIVTQSEVRATWLGCSATAWPGMRVLAFLLSTHACLALRWWQRARAACLAHYACTCTPDEPSMPPPLLPCRSTMTWCATTMRPRCSS